MYEITVNDLAILLVFVLVAFFVTITYLIVGLADVRDLVIEEAKHVPHLKSKVRTLVTYAVAAAFTVVMVTLTLFVVMLRW